MKNLFFMALLVTTFLQFSCATGPSSGVAGTATANVATGAVDVGIDQSFTVTFTAPVKTSTVTTSSFFVVPAESGAEASLIKYVAYDAGICDVASAIDGTVTCTSATECIFTPASELGVQTEYAICLTSDIQFADPDTYGYFEGAMETFTTEAEDDEVIEEEEQEEEEGEQEEEEQEEEEEEVADTTAPTPGNSGTVTTDAVTSLALTLNWTKATDETSDQANLQYKVVKSTSDN